MGEQLGVEREHDLSALTAACEEVGDRWSLPIVAILLDGPRRYGELHQRLPAIAPNVLTARLRRLERDGLVLSTRYCARPPRFDYRLTAEGAALADPIRALTAWAASRLEAAHTPVHELCGTPLQLRWWCPSCKLAPSAEEAEVLA